MLGRNNACTHQVEQTRRADNEKGGSRRRDDDLNRVVIDAGDFARSRRKSSDDRAADSLPHIGAKRRADGRKRIACNRRAVDDFDAPSETGANGVRFKLT